MWIFSYFLPSLTAFNRLSAQWAVAIYVFLIFLFNWGYFTLFEAFWNGRTPGKRIARIRVIQRSGRAIGLFESMARNFIRYIDQIPFFYAVGAIAIFVTRDHQRLGDLAAGTLVVRDRIEEAPAAAESTRTFTANIFAPAVPTPEPHAGFSLPDHGIAKLSAPTSRSSKASSPAASTCRLPPAKPSPSASPRPSRPSPASNRHPAPASKHSWKSPPANSAT